MFEGQRVQATFFVFVLCFSWRTTASVSNGTKEPNSHPSPSPSPSPTSKRNFSSCLGSSNETGCAKCARGYSGQWCSECANGWHGNLTDPRDSCKPCNCSGNLDLQKRHSCHPVTGVCQRCLPNTSGLHCEKCAEGYHGNAVAAKDCTPDIESVHHQNTKELVIIIVCSVLAVICLVVIAMILYRVKKRRCRKEKGTFWKVELSNRNYDNLDFSLLDPVTDTPLVFRADIAGFDEDALLGSEKPQLILETEEGIIG